MFSAVLGAPQEHAPCVEGVFVTPALGYILSEYIVPHRIRRLHPNTQSQCALWPALLPTQTTGPGWAEGNGVLVITALFHGRIGTGRPASSAVHQACTE